MPLSATDKEGWPLVVGARIRGDRGYTLRRRPKARPARAEASDDAQDDFEAALEALPASEERFTPTDECIILRIVPRPKTGGVAVEARCTVTHGIRTYAPECVRVVAGDSAKSLVVRELVEAKVVREKKADRKAAMKAADAEVQEMSKKKRSRTVPQEAALTESSAPPEESRQVPEDLSFLD